MIEGENQRYLVNTNSKKIHDMQNISGRCRISEMRPEYKVFFDTLEEAQAYPDASNPLAKKCRFCFK